MSGIDYRCERLTRGHGPYARKPGDLQEELLLLAVVFVLVLVAVPRDHVVDDGCKRTAPSRAFLLRNPTDNPTACRCERIVLYSTAICSNTMSGRSSFEEPRQSKQNRFVESATTPIQGLRPETTRSTNPPVFGRSCR